ncbi:hypothetical protein BGW80DRAFT_1341825, partial [Lactifluus volemus]
VLRFCYFLSNVVLLLLLLLHFCHRGGAWTSRWHRNAFGSWFGSFGRDGNTSSFCTGFTFFAVRRVKVGWEVRNQCRKKIKR